MIRSLTKKTDTRLIHGSQKGGTPSVFQKG
jgi:hypothetical protein